MASLRVRLVQRASSLDPADNLRALSEVPLDNADLVVFPEAFARDFGEAGSALSSYAEDSDGPFVTRLAGLAIDTAVVAGIFETSDDPDRPFNTLVLKGPDADATYRKIHLFDSFGYKESDLLTPGPPTPVVVDVAGFKVGLMTCYDLRFPELGRGLVDAGAEVFVVPAAWVAGPLKVDHWLTLLRARAIENTVFVVGVGQSGPRYTGHSAVFGPDGRSLAEASTDDAVLDVVLERADLAAARATNPSLGNRRIRP